ncbi:MAG: hypothetical protein AABM66_03785 [Actinomycetota bacterium]
MNAKPRTRRTALAAALVVALALTTGAALAHVKDREYILFNSHQPYDPGQCVKGLARVADGNYDHGFARTRTQSKKDAFQGYCNWEKDKPPGYIRAEMWWMKWHNNNNYWGVCAHWSQRFNPTRTWEYTFYHDFRHVRCGQGDYATSSYNHVWWHGAWRGGGVDGRPHFIWR